MWQKGLDDYQWRELIHLIESVGPRKAMRAAWHSSRDAYHEGFQDLMDRYVAPAEHRRYEFESAD